MNNIKNRIYKDTHIFPNESTQSSIQKKIVLLPIEKRKRKIQKKHSKSIL